MSSYSRRQLEAWLKEIDVKGNVIDIGGSQNPIKGRTKSWNATDYIIIDLKTPHETKEIADTDWDIQDENAGNDFGKFTDLFYKQNIETVFCIEVSEYWYNPLQALKNINLLLRKGGVLYITFHFFYPVHNPENQDYLRYTRAGVKKLLEISGFSIEELQPRYFDQPAFINMLVANEGMRGIGGEINKEQAYCVKAIKI